jgi:hypothetical protein
MQTDTNFREVELYSELRKKAASQRQHEACAQAPWYFKGCYHCNQLLWGAENPTRDRFRPSRILTINLHNAMRNLLRMGTIMNTAWYAQSVLLEQAFYALHD